MKSTGHVFKKYIDFIQFPHYRNIENDTRIHFKFPLTVFTGQNGCGKSSALHALFGTVRGNTPSNFWFDTKVDPIEYFDDQRRRHAFWYSYKSDQGNNLEVVKSRIKRENDPNYWETSRPILSYGMAKLESGRNSPINKNCLYLDFRAELSAFDQFFYFGNVSNIKSINKQEYLRRQSRQLKPILYGEKDFQHNGKGKPINEKLQELNSGQLTVISTILGREYISGKIIKHSLFRTEGYSVLLQSSFAQYSEAFAGSGEVAVVRLVTEILSAQPQSLILLDEPEVSLHPGAQARLQKFLLEQIKQNKHQVVLNTHSPSMIDGLPKEAIKVFNLNPNTNRFAVAEDLHPNEAFFHIQYEVIKSTIYVEDRLAKTIIERVLDSLGKHTSNLFKVAHHPGGAEVIKQQIIPVLSKNDYPNEYLIFDGDQKLQNPLDWTTLSTNEITVDNLDQLIKSQVGSKIKFMVDGNSGSGNHDQTLQLQKLYLEFFLDNVFYLPGSIPEEIIWNNHYAEVLVSDDDVTLEINSTIDFKNKFRILSEALHGNSDADIIFMVQQLFVTRFIKQAEENYQMIVSVLNAIRDKISE